MAKDHYVPQFYLRNFQIQTERGLIYLYGRNVAVRKITIRKAAQAEDYYDLKRDDPTVDKDGVDKLMGMSERNAAPIIQMLLTAPSLTLTEDEKSHLSWFVALLGSRTPFIRETIASIQLAIRNRDIKKMLRDDQKVAAIINEHPEQSPDSIEKACEAFLSDELKVTFGRGGETEDWLMAQQLQFANILVDVLRNKHWNLIETNNSLSFLTSDNPVATMPSPFHPHGAQFGYVDGDILLPISPKRALWFTNRMLANKVIAIHRAKMAEFQFYTITQCDTSLFSHVQSNEFQRILDRTEPGKTYQVKLPENS